MYLGKLPGVKTWKRFEGILIEQIMTEPGNHQIRRHLIKFVNSIRSRANFDFFHFEG